MWKMIHNRTISYMLKVGNPTNYHRNSQSILQPNNPTNSQSKAWSWHWSQYQANWLIWPTAVWYVMASMCIVQCLRHQKQIKQYSLTLLKSIVTSMINIIRLYMYSKEDTPRRSGLSSMSNTYCSLFEFYYTFLNVILVFLLGYCTIWKMNELAASIGQHSSSK